MKYSLLAFFLLLQLNTSAQIPCEYKVNINDSLGSLKETAQYLVYEKVFSGSSKNLFISLINNNSGVLLY